MNPILEIVPQNQREAVLERAAIIESSGEYTMFQAEKLAVEEWMDSQPKPPKWDDMGKPWKK